jgi:hypothetical protein
MKRRIDFDRYAKPVEETVGGGFITGDLANNMNTTSELKEVISLVKPEANILWVSNGKWSAHHMLLALLNITGPSDLHISTYALSETPARHFIQLKETGIIRSLKMVLDNRVDTRTASTLQIIKSIADDYCLIASHAKVTVIENDQWNIAVVGSANYTENERYEAGLISCTEQATEYQKRWIKKALKDGTK